jgi:hypothetical protein
MILKTDKLFADQHISKSPLQSNATTVQQLRGGTLGPKKLFTLIYSIIFLTIFFASCDSNSNSKTLGNSQDTTSVTKGGGPPIQDTATINKNQRDSANTPASDSTSKGNADPTGHTTPKQ